MPRVLASLLNEDSSGPQLTGKDLLAFTQANRVAEELGMSLDLLAHEHAVAKKILGIVIILEAARFYDCHGNTVKAQENVPEVVAELIAGWNADHKSDYHIRDLERRLGVCGQQFAGLIVRVDTKAIGDWLRNLKERDNHGNHVEIAPKTRNHSRNAVVQLFNYARNRGYLPKGVPTEVEGVKPLDVVSPANEIFTVDERITLLSQAPSSPHRTPGRQSVQWCSHRSFGADGLAPGELRKRAHHPGGRCHTDQTASAHSDVG